MNSLYQSHLFVTEPPELSVAGAWQLWIRIFHDYSFGNLQLQGIKTSLLQGFFYLFD